MYINWPICGQSNPTVPNPGLSGYRGMGCGCGCGGGCGQRGLGLFDTGMDITGWGWGEWLTIALGVYVVFSVFSTSQREYGKAKRTVRRIKTYPQRRRAAKRAAQAEELRSRAAALEAAA